MRAASPLQASFPLGPTLGAERATPGEPDPVMAKAGRILARRAHSTQELRDKLWNAGVETDEIDRVIARLTEVRLLDDADFARQWVEQRSRTKGPEGLRKELENKGIAIELIDATLGAAGLDEEAQAKELAGKHLRKVSGKPPLVQAQRIQAMLLRKGFSMEAAVAAARAVLPPEGWD